jgi:hypothetical protein
MPNWHNLSLKATKEEKNFSPYIGLKKYKSSLFKMGVYGMCIAVRLLNTFGPATTHVNAAPSPQADEQPRKEF